METFQGKIKGICVWPDQPKTKKGRIYIGRLFMNRRNKEKGLNLKSILVGAAGGLSGIKCR